MVFRSSVSLVRLYAFLPLLAVLVTAAPAQFSSGSTGADGALNVTEDTTLPIPPDGVFNYTTVNIAEGATLDFDVTTRNLPIIMLAQGDVVIDGTIDVSGQEGVAYNHPMAGAPGSEALPGPGGGHGGVGGISPANTGVPETAIGTSGGGPGGGAAANDSSPVSSRGRDGNGGSHLLAGSVGTGNSNPAAPRYGDFRLITLSGGSGGAGGNINTPSATDNKGPGGGGGGGAILIASSGNITVNGTIDARGGAGRGVVGFAGGGSGASGAGAGGAIRLMGNTVGGTGSLDARGSTTGTNGGNGIIRVEALNHTGALMGNTQPAAMGNTPGIVSIPPSQQPRVRIVSVGGVAVPDDPGGYLNFPDVTIPESESNPLTIEIEGINVPDGAVVTLRIPAANGDTIVTESTPLSGGTATATASIPAGPGAIYTTVAMPE